MPIGRYLNYLQQTNNFKDYLNNLIISYNPAIISKIMCRAMISVAWDGNLYHCDFNQMLELGLSDTTCNHISKFNMQKLEHRRIIIQNHCYGCTAGAGSSCQGKLE